MNLSTLKVTIIFEETLTREVSRVPPCREALWKSRRELIVLRFTAAHPVGQLVERNCS